MNKPVTIIAEVSTPEFRVRLNCILGVFLIEADSKKDLTAFLVAIGMDSHKRLSLIQEETPEYAHLEVDASDFSHALRCLPSLT